MSYELILPPVVPFLRRKENGSYVFNRGHISPRRGKTYEELFGDERAKELKAKISRTSSEAIRAKGKRTYEVGHNARRVIWIIDGKIKAIFPSARHAGNAVGCSDVAIGNYCRGKTRRCKFGGNFFFESDIHIYGDLLQTT